MPFYCLNEVIFDTFSHLSLILLENMSINIRGNSRITMPKTELIYINDYASPKELRGAIRDYIGQYNSIRPHQSFGYLTPDKVYGSSFEVSA